MNYYYIMTNPKIEIHTIKSKDKNKFINIDTIHGIKKIKRIFLINNIIDIFSKQYPIILKLKDLTYNINISYTADNSILDFTFIFANKNKIIIGIYPHLSIRVRKEIPFKSIKEKINFEKAQDIFVKMMLKS